MSCYPFPLMSFLYATSSTNHQISTQTNEKHIKKFPGKKHNIFSRESMKHKAQCFSMYETKLLVIS